MHTEALVKTQSGELYLKKLCRHFARKVPATLSEGRGILAFPFGRCLLEAQADHLRMAVDLYDAAKAPDAERVLGDHLQRMARNESLELQWTRSPR